MEDAITIERRGGPIEAVSGICGVPARLTGFCSLLIQAVIFLISCALVIIFFFHIGGYSYFSNNTQQLSNETNENNDTKSIIHFGNWKENESFIENAPKDEVRK
jgi:hypothetical protein